MRLEWLVAAAAAGGTAEQPLGCCSGISPVGARAHLIGRYCLVKPPFRLCRYDPGNPKPSTPPLQRRTTPLYRIAVAFYFREKLAPTNLFLVTLPFTE